MDTSPSLSSGTLLAGKYRVERVLGEGGMGVVVAALNEALRQRVAIKLLRTGALADAKALGRFEREARAAASLRSEHVARVLDVGKLADGRPYMVMEYLEGRDLGDVIEHEPALGVGSAIDLVLQACEAIAEAHAAGIVHRDLKPKNLFLAATVDGRPLVKVLDFGISKITGAAEDMSLTRTTEIIGSPSYMSPEQLRSSKDVDARTDIWALGVILYELLTKRVPFEAMTVTELVATVLTDPVPDVRVLRPDVPDALADAITRGCLAKKRDERFASVADLVRTIAPFGRGDAEVTMVDRVARVAAGSGRLPPITGSGPFVAADENAVTHASAPPAARDAGTGTGRGALAGAGTGASAGASRNVPPAASSARLAIHGGTSVAWGETQVNVAGPGAVPRRSRWPLVVAAAGLFVVFAAAGTGAFVYVKRGAATSVGGAGGPTPPAPPPSAPAPLPTPSLALPEGRKELPPLASAGSVASTPSVADTTPVPSTLPTTRVPASLGKAPPRGAKPTPAPPVTTAQPAPAVTKPDDLSNIGRR